MSVHAAPPRSADVPGRALAVLGALAVAFGIAFVFAPAALAASAPGGGYSGQAALIDAVRTGFIDYWNSGNRAFPPDLARVVDYWFRYHVAKAVISALLFAVLAALGVLLWRAYLRAGGLGAGKKAALASAWAIVTALAVVAAAAVVANIQGAVAPFASAISMLPIGGPDQRLAGAVAQIHQQLTDYQSSNERPTSPPLQAVISDYTLYHAVLVVLASLVTLMLIGASVTAWRRFAAAKSSGKHARRALASFGVLSILLTLAVIVVLAANVSNTADPIPGLLGVFTG